MARADNETFKVRVKTASAMFGHDADRSDWARLNLFGTLEGFNGAIDTIIGTAFVKFVRDFEVDEELKERLWNIVDAEPIDTIGMMFCDGGEAETYVETNIGISTTQFEALVRESRVPTVNNLQIDIEVEFVARSFHECNKPLKKGNYPIIGWSSIINAKP